MSKFYTIKDLERIMKAQELIDMSKVDFETMNPDAYKYLKEMEKAEKFARDSFLSFVNDKTKPIAERLELGLKALQLYDFSKQSKEGVRFNWVQTQNKFKQYNDGILAKQARENQDISKVPTKPPKS